ncbi:MAG TPA: cytochrome P450 [Terriglobia bacterium]|nr:cytochrome P450 [Terriglobia bacterium]
MPAAAVESALPRAAGLPPGPKGHPLIGSMPELRRDILGFMRGCARDYGNVVYFRFAHIPVCLLTHPDDIESVLVRNSAKFVKSRDYRALATILGNGLLTTEGATWRRQRRMVQPAFHRENILRYAEVMVEFTERTLGGWRDGQSFDVHQAMMQLTLEIVAKCLFGANVAAEAGQVGEALQVVMERFNDYARLAMVLPKWLALPRTSRMGKAVRRLDSIVYAIIQQRRSNPGSPEGSGDLLDMLLGQRDEAGAQMDDRELRDECMTLFLAGHETTALALSWTWYLLSQNPEAEAKLSSELRKVLAGRSPAPSDLPHLPYTDMVIKESLRLYPPAWGIGREAFEAGGFRLPAHTNVFIAPWVTHRDPRYFSDPERFLPERWQDDPIRRGVLPRFAYFPFGGGPRVCVGAGFAQMEAALLLATIAQRFRLSLVAGQRIKLLPSVTLRPKHGVWMRIHAREP